MTPTKTLKNNLSARESVFVFVCAVVIAMQNWETLLIPILWCMGHQCSIVLGKVSFAIASSGSLLL